MSSNLSLVLENPEIPEQFSVESVKRHYDSLKTLINDIVNIDTITESLYREFDHREDECQELRQERDNLQGMMFEL